MRDGREWGSICSGARVRRILQRVLSIMTSTATANAENTKGEPTGQAPIVVYSTTYCPYCIRAKMLLKRRGFAFSEIDVTNDRDKRAWLVERTGMRTVPQIFIGDESVGGFDEIADLDRRGELEPMVRGG
jgi:glutaredoxin 3